MADEGRLQSLEVAMAEQQQLGARLERLMIDMHTQLTQPPPLPPKAEPDSPARLPSLSGAAKGSKLKPAPPSDFDGNRKRGRTFLNQCELYIKLRKSDFADEVTQIHWALSYMKSGRAAVFAEQVISHEATKEEPLFDTWREFREEFEERFCPLNEATTAVNRLESAAYFQGRRELDEYIDEFDELLRRSEYLDERVAVVKFRRGLDPKIQDQIACKEDAPVSLRGWKAAARTIDQNRQANDAFQSTLGSRSKSAFPSATAKPNTLRPFLRPDPPAKDVASASASRSPSAPASSDSSAQKTKRTLGTCFRCGSPDHFSKQCPHAYDVRYMTAEEKQEWVGQVLAEEDAKTGEEAPVEEEGKEDFAPCSG
jgi:hypothetical protein